METQSNILALEVPRTEETWELQSMGWQRDPHATEHHVEFLHLQLQEYHRSDFIA